MHIGAMLPKTTGKPAKSAAKLASRTEGMPRFSIEIPEDLLTTIDGLAVADARSRNAEIRVLLGEAVAARKKNERRG